MRKMKNYLNRNFKKERSHDLLPVKKRSELMSKIRSRDTKLEREFIVALRKATHEKFKTNVNLIKGKPDIVFQVNKLCIFLDSDFWHGWYYPRWKHLLKNDFWREKIENNRRRDRRTTSYLRKEGWRVIRVWEHNVKKNPAEIIVKIIDFICQNTQTKFPNYKNKPPEQQKIVKYLDSLSEKVRKIKTLQSETERGLKLLEKPVLNL